MPSASATRAFTLATVSDSSTDSASVFDARVCTKICIVLLASGEEPARLMCPLSI
jgi:hypothetical protein